MNTLLNTVKETIMFDEVITFFDNYPIFILAFSVVFSWIVKILFEKVVQVFIKKTKTDLDDKIVKRLEAPVFWTIFLIGGYLFFYTVDYFANHLELILNILITIIVFVWTIAILKISKVVITELGFRVNQEGRLADIIPFLKTLTNLATILIALIVIFSIWQIDLTPILASAGVAGFAVAFAAKDTVSNLFGGISVFFDKPYGIGDYVIVDDRYRGEVITVGMRSTKIRTRDDVLLTVPNSVMVTKAVINETGLDGKLRVRVPLGIAYGTNLEKVEKAIVKILKKHPEVMKKPKPRIRYRRFGESVIELEALFVVSNPADRGRVTHEVLKLLDEGLKEEGIELPPPQMDVKLKTLQG